MNYPVWQLDAAGGGLLIALMAVIHVYISHFAVGGGLFLVVTEMKGIRDNNRAIVDYVRRHTRFFLLLTMVAGSLSGVGIWFTISLLNPAATSELIHIFVFAWAIEWVFFAAEIISLFIYYYTFGRMDDRNHVRIGWIYFACAWMSLFFINGIIDFMLTPGSWIENRNFWSGLFNPTFWPALFFRSFLAFMLAGLYGFLTAVNLKEKKLRLSMVRYCALWLIAPFLLFLASAWWYKTALPAELRTLIFDRMPEIRIYLTTFTVLGPALMLGGLIMAIRMPWAVKRPLAVLLLLIGLLYMGSFEFIREAGRRPYIIRDYMYSTAIRKTDMERVRRNGLLQEAKWVRNRTVDRNNLLDAGREIFNILCLPCHSIGGPLNDIRPLTRMYTPSGLEAKISGINAFSPYMPPFPGTAEERKALAAFIAFGLNGRTDRQEDVALRPLAEDPVPDFDPDQSEYILLAWSDMGMKGMTDGDAWIIEPPGVTLNAQLIRRGPTPEVVTDGVTLSYAVDEEYADPAARVGFWKDAEALYNRTIPENTGLTGNGLSGRMTAEGYRFIADQVPVVPYTTASTFQPYPAVTVTATDGEGNILAATRLAAPVSTELGCRTCHGGPWRVDGRAGIADATAENVLATHDRLSGTRLQPHAAAMGPVLCNRCHADSSQNAPGNGEQLNLSAAMHGFHASFIAGRGSFYCILCHPADSGGATRAFRGMHRMLGLDCNYCHGEIEDMAISLLNSELESGKAHAADLVQRIRPVNFGSAEEIVPRKPWENLPDCLDCHVDFQAPEDDTTFNLWTQGTADLYRNRTDESGLLHCAACHGSPHAVYPAVNPYNGNRDILQPLQYQDTPYPIGANLQCQVCHTMEMDFEMHHDNMLRMFRNQ